MKKFLALILALLTFALSFTACKKDEDVDGGVGGGENGNGDAPEAEEIPKFDFEGEDMSLYVELPEAYYKSYTVLIDPDRISEFDVSNYIIGIQRSNKSKEKVEGDGVISVGDVVSIFYKGYYLNGEEKIYFDGGSNEGGAAYELEIGSGSFIPGFEYNMIGKAAADYSAENPMIIETYFPDDYGSAELAGKTAYFEVRVATSEDGAYLMSEYDAPELDESFIYDTLKVEREILDTYEGETLVEKFRALIKELIAYEEGLDETTLKETALWESVRKGIVIKSYPETALKGLEMEVEEDLVNSYNSNPYYTIYFPTFDSFASYALGAGEGESWRDKLTEYAKMVLKEKLAFYYIIQKENLKPSDAEYEEIFGEYLAEALVESGIVRDKYSSEGEYAAACEEFKNKVLASDNAYSIREMILYDYAVEKLLEFAVVTDGKDN